MSWHFNKKATTEIKCVTHEALVNAIKHVLCVYVCCTVFFYFGSLSIVILVYNNGAENKENCSKNTILYETL